MRTRGLTALVTGLLAVSCVADKQSIEKKRSDVSLSDTVVVSLTTQQTTLARTEELTVLFTITNHSPETFTFLPWATPLEAVLSADNFEVLYNGKVLPYVGRIVKRAAPAEADYLHIEPGEEVTSSVNLSYAYEINAPGTYQVHLRTDIGKYRAHGHLLMVTSQPLVIERL